jgi:lipopolysaccharide assembly outer membrane protein LptD (OstA)
LTWSLDYRTDTNVDGAVGVGASTQLLGRWDVFAASQRDLDRDEWLAYSFGLRRNDHDWSIELVGVYNPFSDETTVRLDFLPRFGGLGGGRSARFPGFDGPDQFATSY